MFKGYLKITWRNLLKHKSFSFINILGLAIGIAVCMIIFLYVDNELTFDQYNTKVDRIARVTTTLHAPESDVALATSPAPLADALKRDYPEVESAVRLENVSQVVKLNNDVFPEEAFYKTDQSVFSIFSFDFLEGSPAGSLQKPHSIVITETIAKKYFGDQSAKGKTMVCNGQAVLVTGVVKNRPANSDIRIDALLSANFSKMTSWSNDFSCYTFILFFKNPDLKKFGHKLAALSAKYVQSELNATGENEYKIDFEPESMSAVHFSSGKLEDTPKGNRQFNYVFSLLAVLILVIALLNYINLSTAKSTERAKEVGIRKVSGATQFQLILQFLFESLLLLALACAFALGLLQIGLPVFNKLLQTNLSTTGMQATLFTGAIFLVSLLLAGLYPAFVLSAFRPVKVLKGNWRQSRKGTVLRKTVTIFQFAIAAALILGTTVIYSQMKFIEEKDLGFNKDQLLNIYLPRDSVSMNSVHSFQDALRGRPEVRGLTVGDGMTLGGSLLGSIISEARGKKRELMCYYYSIDENFLPVFQIQLLKGRNLSQNFATDKKEAFLVNEAFVKAMGWKTAVGQAMDGYGHKGRVVGVVKNFYFSSLHNLVGPTILVYNTHGANTATVRIRPSGLPIVKALFKTYFPSLPFNYSFFDEILNKQYEQDRITMSLFSAFAVLAILVSCLGLYGLVALIAVQRTKEIGIRKLMGASLNQLFSLLAGDFIILVFVAIAFALPVAGMVMNKWLSAYAYHIQVSWWMFLIPVLVTLLIALTVIGREIIKTATANPVKSLRAE